MFKKIKNIILKYKKIIFILLLFIAIYFIIYTLYGNNYCKKINRKGITKFFKNIKLDKILLLKRNKTKSTMDIMIKFNVLFLQYLVLFCLIVVISLLLVSHLHGKILYINICSGIVLCFYTLGTMLFALYTR